MTVLRLKNGFLMATLRLIVVSLLVTSCASTETHWEEARKADTTAAYAHFLARHSSGPLADAARARYRELEFAKAREKDTVKAYQDFIGYSQPETPLEIEAATLIYEKVKNSTTPEPLEAYFKRYPNVKAAEEARKQASDMRYKDAIEKNTPEAYANFLKGYPQEYKRVMETLAIQFPVSAQIDYLYGRDPVQSAYAALRLGNMGEEAISAIPFLKAKLGDSTPLVKLPDNVFTTPGKEAAFALSKMGQEGVRALAQTIVDTIYKKGYRKGHGNEEVGNALAPLDKAGIRLPKNPSRMEIENAFRLTAMGQITTSTKDGKLKYTLRYSAVEPIGSRALRSHGVSGQVIYDSPKDLLPTDQSTKLIMTFAQNELYPYKAITNCVIRQEAGYPNTIVIDAGTDGDNYVVAVLHYTRSTDISKGFDYFVPMHFEDGAVHTIVGTVFMGGYKFDSDGSDPLIFRVDYKNGYVYVNGSGTITDSRGEKINEGRPTKQLVLGKPIVR